ncbi:hypothetical protein LN040_03800 [Desulfovibrio subterraneus]|uniref:HEPN domain-containing protein n=1 Tax=Desulfovibrio subterraneus TaxID=2718620 RepID=UPI0022B88642|nr:HEPN domain-containing protein [Desulfovibrio subterraneus]WBF68237.1 hypothetical protein LN040_03800 [Desulfovibrio subterraneus]
MGMTPQFRVLKKRIKELRKHFLPKKPDLAGDYSDRRLDYARAYLVLAHAEVEHYFEDVAKGIAIKYFGEWKSHRKCSSVILSLVACYKYNWDIQCDSESLKGQSSKKFDDAVFDLIDDASRQFIGKIQKNNGVKADNIKDLVIPIGIPLDSLDSVWLNDMDAFGSRRGDVVHKASGVQGAIDPFSEKAKIESILLKIQDLDERFYALLN